MVEQLAILFSELFLLHPASRLGKDCNIAVSVYLFGLLFPVRETLVKKPHTALFLIAILLENYS